MEIKYIYSACLQIKTCNLVILTDPWFSEGAFDGSWHQYPKIDPFDFIEEPDYIYISHIHPDHYDPKFLHKLFNKYGTKPILIPDLENNYLQKKAMFDGLTVTPTRYLELEDIEIFIEENDTGSLSDIDSALIVYDKKNNISMLNLNDCIYNKPHVEILQNIIGNFNNKLNFLALGYSGAGPYPQMYYDINSEKKLLLNEVSKKKKVFFERYNIFKEAFPANFNLPFAGEHILGGKLTKLNEYRGIPDAIEVKNIDEDAIILKNGGSIDLISNNIDGQRDDFHPIEHLHKRYKEVESYKFDYETDIVIEYKKIDFMHLLRKAATNALKKSEINFEYCYVFSILDQDEETKSRFAVNCLDGVVKPINISDEINLSAYNEVIIDYRYLFGLLTKIYHWNNADIGSQFYTRRHPKDNFNREVEHFLNFFTIT